MTLKNVAKYTNAVPIIGNLIHNKDSKNRLAFNAVLSNALFGAIGATAAYFITQKMQGVNMMRNSLIVGASLFLGLCLAQTLEYFYHKSQNAELKYEDFTLGLYKDALVEAGKITDTNKQESIQGAQDKLNACQKFIADQSMKETINGPVTHLKTILSAGIIPLTSLAVEKVTSCCTDKFAVQSL